MVEITAYDAFGCTLAPAVGGERWSNERQGGGRGVGCVGDETKRPVGAYSLPMVNHRHLPTWMMKVLLISVWQSSPSSETRSHSSKQESNVIPPRHTPGQMVSRHWARRGVLWRAQPTTWDGASERSEDAAVTRPRPQCRASELEHELELKKKKARRKLGVSGGDLVARNDEVKVHVFTSLASIAAPRRAAVLWCVKYMASSAEEGGGPPI